MKQLVTTSKNMYFLFQILSTKISRTPLFFPRSISLNRENVTTKAHWNQCRSSTQQIASAPLQTIDLVPGFCANEFAGLETFVHWKFMDKREWLSVTEC
jgi:hypothetical protein